MRGGGKLGVSPAAPPAFCHQEALPRSVEIPESFPAAGVVDDGADGYHYGEIIAILAVPVGAFAVSASLRAKKAVVAELQQGVHVLGAFQDDIATPPAVPSAGPAAWNELFPAEGYTTISAPPAGNMDLGFVNEHVESRSARQMAEPDRVPPFRGELPFCGEIGAR